jgi:hypothetical protein
VRTRAITTAWRLHLQRMMCAPRSCVDAFNKCLCALALASCTTSLVTLFMTLSLISTTTVFFWLTRGRFFELLDEGACHFVAPDRHKMVSKVLLSVLSALLLAAAVVAEVSAVLCACVHPRFHRALEQILRVC